MRSSLFLILLSIYTFLFFFLLYVSWLFSLLIHFTPINPTIEFDKKKSSPINTFVLIQYFSSSSSCFFFFSFFGYLIYLLFAVFFIILHWLLTLSLSLSPHLSPICEVATPSSHHTPLCSLSVNLDPFVSRQSKCFLNSDLMSATSLFLGEIPAPPVIYPFFVFFLIFSCFFYFFAP